MKWVNLLFILLLCIFVFSFSYAFFPQSVEAAVNKIVFTTDSQTIAANTISEPITFQLQDATGNSFETTETLDLVFTSTSATGEFLGSSGNAAGKTMNKNTANRTFYYRDSKEGSFTLKVVATGRDSGLSLSTSQVIKVGNPSTVSSSQTSTTVTGSGSSATSLATPVSKTALDSSFEIYAGSDRLTAAGSPILFQALVKKSNDASRKPEFSWSFGDGTVGGGMETSHTYKYPGTYAVVLTGKFGQTNSISRLTARVIEPQLELSVQQGFVEIKNNGSEEINLFNWKIMSGIYKFIFQPDTIIFPNASVRFDNELLRFNAFSIGETILFDSLGRRIVSSLDTATPVVEPLIPEEVEEAIEEPKQEEQSVSQAAAVIVSELPEKKASSTNVLIYEAPQKEKKNWWHKIVDLFFK